MRLEISRRADLAVRALLLLADADGRCKAGELARRLETTVGFVPQVVAPLVQRGWVRSDPGPRGGYSAATRPGPGHGARCRRSRRRSHRSRSLRRRRRTVRRCSALRVARGVGSRPRGVARRAARGVARAVGCRRRAMSTISVPSARPTWRSVALPTEHGGWGLTLEPVLLGMIVAPSVAGLALGGAAFLAFVARTPVKVVLVDRYRHRRPRTNPHRDLDRCRRARPARGAGDRGRGARGRDVVDPPRSRRGALRRRAVVRRARSRSRRLLPELCGAVGIAAVVSAIVVADDGSGWLALALWMVLAARRSRR